MNDKITIDRDAVEALDALEDLPDDRPGMTLGPAGKAELALRRLLPNTEVKGDNT